MPEKLEKWYEGTVDEGKKLGRTIGFPTLNLDPSLLPLTTPTGVYAALVKYRNREYKGALYYGPRLVLGEKKNVLEIYLLDFNQDIYGEKLRFVLKKFLRSPQPFADLDSLKKQLLQDKELVDKSVTVMR